MILDLHFPDISPRDQPRFVEESILENFALIGPSRAAGNSGADLVRFLCHIMIHDLCRAYAMWTRRAAASLAMTVFTTMSMKSRARAQLDMTRLLAPTGKMRVAVIVSNPVLVTRRSDDTLGGISVAIAYTLAAHLAVPVELKPYESPTQYNDSLGTDDWDVGFAARDPSRSEKLAFSLPFMEVDNGYVARAGAAPTNADNVDRAGVRIAVAKGSAPHSALQRLIKNAEIVPVPGGFEPARDALRIGQADVYGDNMHLAYRIADALPGAHVLPGHFNKVQITIGVRKRAAAALPVIDAFVSQIRADGTVQRAINEVGLRGVQVPQQ